MNYNQCFNSKSLRNCVYGTDATYFTYFTLGIEFIMKVVV